MVRDAGHDSWCVRSASAVTPPTGPALVLAAARWSPPQVGRGGVGCVRNSVKRNRRHADPVTTPAARLRLGGGERRERPAVGARACCRGEGRQTVAAALAEPRRVGAASARGLPSWRPAGQPIRAGERPRTDGGGGWVARRADPARSDPTPRVLVLVQPRRGTAAAATRGGSNGEWGRAPPSRAALTAGGRCGVGLSAAHTRVHILPSADVARVGRGTERHLAGRADGGALLSAVAASAARRGKAHDPTWPCLRGVCAGRGAHGPGRVQRRALLEHGCKHGTRWGWKTTSQSPPHLPSTPRVPAQPH